MDNRRRRQLAFGRMNGSRCYLAFLAFAWGCSSTTAGGSPSAGSDPFVGTWNCMATSTSSNLTASATETEVVTDDGKGNLTVVITSMTDAGVLSCTLKSTLNADKKSSTLVAGQTCTAAGVTVTYNSGTSTLNADGTTSTTSAFTIKASTNTASGTGLATCTKM
jgi:hypothetical protein